MYNQNDSFIPAMFQYNMPNSNINIDNALASILDKFEPNYIMDVINQSLSMKFRLYDQPMPNIVYGYEQQFSELLNGFESNRDDIAAKRQDTYISIINTLCDRYNLAFNNNDDIDYYSAAFYLYKFLVSEFTQNIITFFTNFLIQERDMLVGSLDLKDSKKNDSYMAYSIKLFKSSKMSAIHGNIGYIIQNMSTLDIDLYAILNLIYPDKKIARYIFSLITDKGNFFRDHFESYAIDAMYGPEIQTQIKLSLQTCASELMDEAQ